MKRGRFANAAIAVWLTAALLAIGAKTAFDAGYRLNETPSVPLGLWRIETPDRPLRRGDIVSVCPPDTLLFRTAFERGYLSRGRCPSGLQPLLKPIAALSGDRVSISAGGVSVNGVLLKNSRALDHDRKSRSMPRVPYGQTIVGPGEVWLMSASNAAGFDSRYFGQMPVSTIIGIAYPVWTCPSTP